MLVRPGTDRQRLAPGGETLVAHLVEPDVGSVVAALRESRADVVFHLASLFRARHEPDDVGPLVEANVLFGARLLEAMRVVGCRRLVNTGSAWQHFGDRADGAVSLYAATKQAFESLLQFYTDSGWLEAVTLVLYDTFGPGDTRPKFLNLLRAAAREGRVFEASPGEQQLDLVHVDDVVEAYVHAAGRLLEGRAAGHERFAVCSGEGRSLREIAAAYAEASGRELSVRWGARPYRDREPMQPWRKGAVLPGWTPRWSLRDGLSQLAEEDRGKS